MITNLVMNSKYFKRYEDEGWGHLILSEVKKDFPRVVKWFYIWIGVAVLSGISALLWIVVPSWFNISMVSIFFVAGAMAQLLLFKYRVGEKIHWKLRDEEDERAESKK